MLNCVVKGIALHRSSRPADSGGSRYAQAAFGYRQMVTMALFALLADRALAG